MLNQPLMDLLQDILPESDWQVANEDRPAQVIMVTESGATPLSAPNGREDQMKVQVVSWGEVYKGRCPVCERAGSNKKRLFLSHVSGQFVSLGNKQARAGIIYVCHNEHCRVPEITAAALRMARLPSLSIEGNAVSSDVPYQVLSDACVLPKKYALVNDPGMPEQFREYLQDRGFDLEELARTYRVGYAPKDSTWFKPTPSQALNGIEESVTYQDRIVIPIICQRMLVGFQARRIDGEEKYKYLNKPNGLSKSSLLYNLDTALLRREVCVCEGVTDVWKVGDRGVATFGREPSAWQRWALATGWRGDGMGILIPDRNDPKAGPAAADLRRYLVEQDAFPRGCHILELAEGTDPGSYPAEELREYVEQFIAYYDAEEGIDAAE